MQIKISSHDKNSKLKIYNYTPFGKKVIQPRSQRLFSRQLALLSWDQS